MDMGGREERVRCVERVTYDVGGQVLHVGVLGMETSG